jgi:hypothetical protein
MVIQIDGKYAGATSDHPGVSGQIPCVAVCIIPGKLINILTRIPDSRFPYVLEETQNPDGTVTKRILKDGVEIDPYACS